MFYRLETEPPPFDRGRPDPGHDCGTDPLAAGIFPEAQGQPAFTLTEFAGESGDVEDPFGQPERAYALCKDEIKRCLLRIVDRWAGEIGGTQWVRSS